MENKECCENKESMNVSAEQPKLATHDSAILDLAFVMDCTGSMGSYIENARNSIRTIVEEIVAAEKSDILLALVEYRDHPPQEESFVSIAHDFTSSVKEMKNWLDECSAVGGGDAPEAVADGLHDALKLSWREKSTKICVLIADAPPHGLSANGDSMPNGCPNGIDPVKVVRQMAEKGITLYSIGCEPSLLPYKDFFAGIAYTTGGQYVPLRNANLLAKVIIGGAAEEISLEKLMEEVQTEVEIQMQASGGAVDEEALTSAVYTKLSSRGVTTKNLKLNSQSLERASEHAVKYSKMSCLSDLNAEFAKTHISDSPIIMESHAYAPKYSMCSRVMRTSVIDAPVAPMACYAAEPLVEIAPEPVKEDAYTIETDVINTEQASRLVTKALNRKK